MNEKRSNYAAQSTTGSISCYSDEWIKNQSASDESHENPLLVWSVVIDRSATVWCESKRKIKRWKRALEWNFSLIPNTIFTLQFNYIWMNAFEALHRNSYNTKWSGMTTVIIDTERKRGRASEASIKTYAKFVYWRCFELNTIEKLFSTFIICSFVEILLIYSLPCFFFVGFHVQTLHRLRIFVVKTVWAQYTLGSSESDLYHNRCVRFSSSSSSISALECIYKNEKGVIVKRFECINSPLLSNDFRRMESDGLHFPPEQNRNKNVQKQTNNMSQYENKAPSR